MDLTSIIGLVGSLSMIVIGIFIGGGNPMNYFHLPSIVITIGGATFATIASNRMDNVKKFIDVIKTVFINRKIDPIQVILTLLSFSEKARREGLLALEDDLEEVNDTFFRFGIQLVIDGAEPELVKNIMSSELEALDTRHETMRKMLEDMAIFSPAFGMIGTLIGLIIMLKHIGGDPASIGRGMSAALLTTFYGAILANGIFVPISAKLQKNHTVEIMMREIIVEGTLSIQAGDNPRILQQKLMSYFPPDIRDKIDEQIGEA